jgi:hypothetical protein
LSTLPLNFSCIALTETWLNDNNVSYADIKGYNHIYKYRTNRPGGGVSLFLNDKVPFTLRDDLCEFNDSHECLFIEVDRSIYNTKSNIIIGVMYRIPGQDISTFNTYFKSVLERIKQENKIVYYNADFNINILNANEHTATNDFIELVFSFSCIPLITRPSRITNVSSTLIDNIFTNNFQNSECLKGLFINDISDHFPIFCIATKNKLKQNEDFSYIRKYTKVNLDKFTSNIEAEKLNEIYRETDPELAMTKLHECLCRSHNKSFPLVKVKHGYVNRKPWLNETLKRLIGVKNKMYISLRNHYTAEKENMYKRLKQSLKKNIRKAEKDYYLQILDKHKKNSKKTWETLKNVINAKRKSIKEHNFEHNGTKISDPKIIAERFNNFFVNVGPSLAAQIKTVPNTAQSYLIGCYNDNFFLSPTTDIEVSKIIGSLKNNSPGYDNINAKVLKHSINIYLPILVYIINLSFSSGIFPSVLKPANVIPLFKSGNTACFTNYRPVSLLPTVSKVFERLYYNRLYSFLEKYNILYNLQFGFRKGLSTNFALLTLMDKIISAIDRGEYAVGVFLDFSKAFDTVDHKILIGKLYHYGIRGTPLEWIQSYLSNREQMTTYNGFSSPKRTISCGVPQGSILGPLLFLLYINDLAHVSSSLFTIMFADDSNCFVTGKDLPDITNTLNNELSKIVTWLKANKLSLNIDKTHYMLFQPKRKYSETDLSIKIESKQIERVSHCKFLGVVLDDKLSWKYHILHLKVKLSKVIGIMYRARTNLDASHLTVLYKSLFEPYLFYCNTIWSCACKTTLLPLRSLQNAAMKCIFYLSKRANTDDCFKELKVLTVDNIRSYCTLLFVYKFHHHKLPTMFNNCFVYNNEIHDRHTRQMNLLHVPIFRSMLSKSFIRYYGTILWNDMYPIVNPNVKISTYKAKIREHLLS